MCKNKAHIIFGKAQAHIIARLNRKIVNYRTKRSNTYKRRPVLSRCRTKPIQIMNIWRFFSQNYQYAFQVLFNCLLAVEDDSFSWNRPHSSSQMIGNSYIPLSKKPPVLWSICLFRVFSHRCVCRPCLQSAPELYRPGDLQSPFSF